MKRSEQINEIVKRALKEKQEPKTKTTDKTVEKEAREIVKNMREV